MLLERDRELEREFAYGVVRQAFEPLARGLSGVARLAAPAFGGAGEPSHERYAVIHGLYWLAADLASERPLLVLVDDLQWADAPSQRFLAYLARRLEGLPVALLVAIRPALPGEDRALVDPLLGEPLRPSPLSPAAVATLSGAAPALAAACHAATGGNPLLVTELLAEAAEHGAASPAAIERLTPDRVAHSVRRRLAALGPAPTALARAAAILGDGSTLDAATALAGVEVAGAVAPLVAADVLADAPELRFRHPVVRAAVLDGIPAAERALAHGRAARIAAARGGATAPHLLASAPAADPWVVAELRAAAATARGQGAPELAATLLERALREPPAAGERVAVLRELGAAEVAAGSASATGHLSAALELDDDPRGRAELALQLAAALHERLDTRQAADVLRRALHELDGGDRELELTLRTQLAARVRMDLGAGGPEVGALLRTAATLAGDTPAERVAIATAATLRSQATAAEHARVAELMERSLVPPPESGIVSGLIRAGRLDDATTTVARRLGLARAEGALSRSALLLQMRGWIALERGDLRAAEADVAASLDMAAELALPPAPPGALLAVILAEQGRLDAAAEALAAVDGELAEHQIMNMVLFNRARVRLALGRREDGLADLEELGRRYARWGIRRAVPPWRSLAALAGGDPALAEEELALAREWGTPAALGVAERALGLLTRDLDRLAAAVATLGASPARLEYARAEIELGAALRRAGRRADAREPLRRGMDAAHACGAAPLAERARVELQATGARPRRLALTGADALTASERRVAGLAAQGLTNRAIAQELFVTTATVETHLRHAFQKLDVGSRAELAEKIKVDP